MHTQTCSLWFHPNLIHINCCNESGQTLSTVVHVLHVLHNNNHVPHPPTHTQHTHKYAVVILPKSQT